LFDKSFTVAEAMIKAGKIKTPVNRSKEHMKSANPRICMVILCGISGIMSSSGSSDTLHSAAISNSQTQSGGKEVTIVVDHFRPPCVDRAGPQWCYLLGEGERPSSFPYYYGDIEGFKYLWGHEYRLRVVQDEAPRSAASRYSYRLIKVLSDKKAGPKQTFSIPLKLPLNPPFLNVDEASNLYLLGEVKITTINATLKARLLRLLETAAPMDSIDGTFQHDQKRENVITLISLRHEKN
jgi:hypothetical protein